MKHKRTFTKSTTYKAGALMITAVIITALSGQFALAVAMAAETATAFWYLAHELIYRKWWPH